jgi:uncharacterized zinc-type alcohol dehydrogenase-like protein
MEAQAKSFDFLLSTIPQSHDLQLYLNLLKQGGTLIIVGALTQIEPGINGMNMAGRRLSIGTSLIGGIKETQEMLDYSAKNNIAPSIELIKMEDINKAFDRMVNKDVRYRFVIDLKASFK